MSIYGTAFPAGNTRVKPDESLRSLMNSNSNFTPALSNLYEIDILAANDKILSSTEGMRLNYLAKFHATDITINGESISFERHPTTKTFYLGSSSLSSSPYTRVDDISITWRESNDWFIKRYHEAWIGLFYDKDTDTFKSVETETAQNTLYRTFRIKLPYSYNGNQMILVVQNVLPTNTGNLSLRWSNNPDLVTHQMTYKAERIYWENAPEIQIGDNK